uniref:NADH-ubiquinone oxidoreductase chain 2 n=1 Tax=Bothropolys sp. SP-2004 TaxID=292347 RepID=A5D6J0_9MYRI|nr:NADH dehydrogenase subunit 2 [Bothropolys sp. SP-2004]
MLIKIIFLTMLFSGTIISISSSTWISVWIGLELNLMAFIPLLMSKHNQQGNEATLKYFLIQAFASIFLLTSILLMVMKNYFIFPLPFINHMLTTMILLKMGAAPFHFWFPAIIQGLNWQNCFILMTWQKLAPLFIILTMNMNIIIFSAIASAWIGAIGGYNQMMLRKILAYSSINHLGWLLTSTMMSEIFMLIYFTFYSILNLIIITMTNKWNINHLTQIPSQTPSKNLSMTFITNLLSLGGLPPFLGFLPKWIIISQMINKLPFQMFSLIMSSLITLYFYLRVSYTLILKSHSTMNFQTMLPSKLFSFLTMCSITGLVITYPLI